MLLISIIVISIIGTLSHFLYDISNHNKILGLFTAVNESTWEHIKIALITINNFFKNVYTKNFMAMPLYIKYYTLIFNFFIIFQRYYYCFML